MTDFLAYGFAQRALVTGVLLGLSCAVLAFFVVLRRMAFIGVGISHAALGGVALGVVLGISPVLAATVFSVGVAWLIGWVAARGRVSEDTTIGVFFPTAMALGVALISFSPTYRQDLMGYLFGSILSVRPVDVVSRIAVPVLMVVGAEEPGQWMTEALQAALPPHSSTWVMKGAGHGGFIEVEPMAYPARLREYFGGRLGASQGRSP